MARLLRRKQPTKTQIILQEVGSELKQKEPRIVGKTRAKFGQARASAQMTAILLNKARRRGARIKKPKRRSKRQNY